MADGALASLLSESFEVLAREHPQAYARLGARLEGVALALKVDDERFSVTFSHAKSQVLPPLGWASADLSTTRRTILDVLDARQSLADAVVADAVRVVGPLETLMHLHEGLQLYLQGAVRCPGFEPLLRKLRQLCASCAAPDSPQPPGANVPERQEPPRPDVNEPKKANRPKVYVYGGGIAGLTAAHELILRGFDVSVYELERTAGATGVYEDVTLGGMARTQYFVITDKDVPSQKPVRPGPMYSFKTSDTEHLRPLVHNIHQKYVESTGLRSLPSAGMASGGGRRGAESAGYFPEFWIELKENEEHKLVPPTDDQALDDAIQQLNDFFQTQKHKPDRVSLLREANGSKIFVQAFSDPGVDRAQRINIPIGGAAIAAVQKAEDIAEDVCKLLRTKIKDEGLWKLVTNYNKLMGQKRSFPPLSAYTSLAIPPIARNWVRIIVYTPMLPGEHGYRFFPSFYRHVFDTMQRIPLYDDSGQPARGSVYDNLVPLPRIAILSERSAPFVANWEPLHAADTFALVERSLRDLRELGLSPWDVAQFSLRILRYMTTCSRRRAAELEDMTWWDYLEGYDPKTGKRLYRYSDYFAHLVKSSSRVMVALDGERGDARTCGNTFVQLANEALVATPQNNSTLNGPTSEAWFYHWYRHLDNLGVEFHNGRLEGFEFQADGRLVAHVKLPEYDPQSDKRDKIKWTDDKPHGAPDENGQEPEAVYFVVATDLVGAQKATETLRPPIGVPGHLQWYVRRAPRYQGDPGSHAREPTVDGGKERWDRFQMLSGVQFFFEKHVRLCEGYVYCIDSDWRLSAIASQVAWQNPPISSLSRYQSVISVDVGEWRHKSRRIHKSAWECTPEELAQEVFNQLQDSLRAGPAGEATEDFELPEPDYIHIDDGVLFGSPRQPPTANKTPYLVPTAGDWKHRPPPEPWNPTPQAPESPPSRPDSREIWQAKHGGYWVHWDRLVFAGTYNRTFTRMTTMESANESARHAVNAIIDHYLAHHLPRGAMPPQPPRPGRSPNARRGYDEDVFPTTPLGDYCRIWDPERHEPPDLMLLQRLDEVNFEQGLPHPWDLLGLEKLPSLLSHLPVVLDPISRVLKLVKEVGTWTTPRATSGLLAVLRQIRALLEATRSRGAQRFGDRPRPGHPQPPPPDSNTPEPRR